MTKTEERLEAVFDRTDKAITLLRIIRGLVQKGKHVDLSNFLELSETIASLRHNVEMHNTERLEE